MAKGASLKQDAILGGVIGLGMIGTFFVTNAAMNNGQTVGSELPWDGVDSALWIFVMLLPGIYLGGFGAMLLGHVSPHPWTAGVLSVVFNTIVYSASWVLLRRAGPGAGVRRVVVATPWLLYVAFVVMFGRISW